MSSDKKRKAVEDNSTNERPKTNYHLSNTTSSVSPTHVYVAQCLNEDSYGTFEHETIGIYTSCEVENAAAHNFHNLNSSYRPWTIRKPIEPEHEKFRNGKEFSSRPDDDLEESPDGQLGCVRKRHDGGLRFGASSESGTYVVWVERKGLDTSWPPAIPRSGGAIYIPKIEPGT